MDFRIRKDARTWFKGLDAVIGASAKGFEYYYFCLCVGLMSGNKLSVSASECDALIDYYPNEYKAKGRILVAWMISKELETLGIDVSERSRVHETIRTLVDPHSSTSLSEFGMEQMNGYAGGGFDVLSEGISEPPRVLPSFLLEYTQLLNELETEGS
jgi:hypothetical protein